MPGATGDDASSLAAFAFEVGYLKNLRRAGWGRIGIRDGESIADHSFRVAVLAFMIAEMEGANAERAGMLGLFHDCPETRVTDLTPVAKPYVQAADPRTVIADQTADLPESLAGRIRGLIAEHESAKDPGPSPEALASMDGDRLDCLFQAREYQLAGNNGVQPWIDSMLRGVKTPTGKAMADAALALSPSVWWDKQAAPSPPGEDRPADPGT